jgi:mono/diheme cytochrome c family protein
MKPILGNAVAVFLLALGTQTASAQDLGDPRAGAAYADQICSECHGVHSGVRVSPNERAPAFQIVAETRGMSEMALRAWFRTPHPSMPNLVIRNKDADDVISYILSLKRRP